ncbi:MAG TPA: NUDIX hydrolase [Acidimicrobiales bacterium]|nr:NUDIX hydrolase [Acidimicrobiales bacterium]
MSFARLDDNLLNGPEGALRPACSLVIVQWGKHVLLGFNVSRQQWELPGGSLDEGESAYKAAIRELEEETGIRADRVSQVARADFFFEGKAASYSAAVFAFVSASDPKPVESDELSSFHWWIPTDELWDGLSPLDAEVIRRCLPFETNDTE